MSERVSTEDGAECVATWCAGEEWCGVTCAMDVLGNKWNPVVVHRLLEADAGRRFSDLSADLGDVTNKVLSETLEDLEEHGIVERTVFDDRPVAVEYALTEYGRTLEPVVEALEEWGRTHVRRTAE